METGIYGGTFNPVHLGHIHLLKAAAPCFDRILVMPDRVPPHKEAEMLASGEDRAAMLRLAVSDIPKAEVCTLELEAEGLTDGGRLTLSGGTFTPNQYAVAVYPDLDMVPDTALESTETDYGHTVLLPDQDGQTFGGLDGFSVILGFDNAGQFHLRTVLLEGYGMTASSYVLAYLEDGDTYITEAEDVAHLEDGQDIQVEGITQRNWEQLKRLWLITSYEGPLEAIEGNWKITLDAAKVAGVTTPEGFSLALPWRAGGEFPLTPLFCFARLERLDGGDWLVFSFNSRGCPMFPPGHKDGGGAAY